MTALKWLLPILIFNFIPFSSLAENKPNDDSLRIAFNLMDTRSMLVFANKMAAEDHDLAIYAFDAAIIKASKENQNDLLIAAFRDKGFFWEDLGRLDSADTYYTKALKQAEYCKNETELRNLMNDLAIVARKAGKYKIAKEYHLQALDKAQLNHDDELVEFSWHGLGFLYEMVGDHEQALKYYKESFNTAEKRGHQNGMMATLGNLAEVFEANGKPQEALIHIKKALDLAMVARDTEQLAQLNFTYGDILALNGESCAAETYFLTAIRWNKILHDKSAEAEAYLRLGEIALHEKNYPQAVFYFQTAIKNDQLIPARLKCEAYLNLGKVAMLEANSNKALFFLQKSNRIAQEFKLPDLEINTSLALHEWFMQHKQAAQSLGFLERTQFLRDSISEVLRAQGSAELGFRYDLEKNKRNLDAMKVRDSRIRALLALLLGLIGAAALGYVIVIKKRTNQVLTSKNDAIRDQNQRLEDSNKLLHQFTYAVAHDLKEPLRSISGFITLLERRHGSHFTGAGIEYMGFVQTGVKKMNALIGDLLAFSNISSQRAGEEWVNSGDVLTKVLAQMKSNIIEKNSQVICQPNLPKVKINPTHLEFIFQNLIQNAIKFNDTEKPIVRINASYQHDKVLFSVEDNGIGIDQIYSDKIFDLFNQLHKNKSYTGTGIGLTVCKNIVDKYNGRIWFESAVVKGTRFWVSLPV
jgi:signal transduction histidine kinase